MDAKKNLMGSRFSNIILHLLFAAFLICCYGINTAEAVSRSEYAAPAPEDFSNLSWSDAFEKLHFKISHEYAFTDWKKIDWSAMYIKTKPKITAAQASGDFTGYYLALKEYLHCIPDGHVRMTSILKIDNRYIGGCFGFSAVKLSDGELIASWVDEKSEAFAKGMRAGAEIIEWDGRPAEDVLNDVPVIFGPNSATAEDLINQRARYLTRAPIGTAAVIRFSNLRGNTEMVSVTAYDDKGKTLRMTYPYCVLSDGLRDLIIGSENPQSPPESMVEKKILNGNIGYIKLWGELDIDLEDTGKTPSTLGLFKKTLTEFNFRGVKGLILDIRNNVGGLDSMVADMLGSFYTQKELYEYQNSYNTITGRMEIRPDPSIKKKSSDPGLYIYPASPFFSGAVAVLINSKCVSSAEGLAKGIKNLQRGEAIGFYGTNGSFGLAGDEARLPGGLEVHWPYGQSLDKNKIVQIDSRNGHGGVSPSIRIPMTLDNALKTAEGEDVELEYALSVINSLIR